MQQACNASREVRVAVRLLLAVGACVTCQSVLAQSDGPVPEATGAPARLEINATALPRLDGQEAMRGPRIDLTLMSPRPSAVGLTVGMSNFAVPASANGAPPAPGFAATPPSMDLGVHVRHTTDSSYQVDISAWRRMTPQPEAYTLVQLRNVPTYGARVEMNLSKRSGIVSDLGFVGLQLEGGARISLKRKDGRPMVYYRTKF